jgi:hypothetical protein
MIVMIDRCARSICASIVLELPAPCMYEPCVLLLCPVARMVMTDLPQQVFYNGWAELEKNEAGVRNLRSIHEKSI